MNNLLTLSAKLERYVQELDRVTKRWQNWLMEIESQSMFAGRSTILSIEASTSAGNQMIQELGELLAKREGLLAESRATGAYSPTLSVLARSLPIWSSRSFRKVFEAARLRLSHLQRSQFATWILLKHSADYCQESLMLMMSGKTRNDFTIGEDPPDAGGQLLDASL